MDERRKESNNHLRYLRISKFSLVKSVSRQGALLSFLLISLCSHVRTEPKRGGKEIEKGNESCWRGLEEEKKKKKKRKKKRKGKEEKKNRKK